MKFIYLHLQRLIGEKGIPVIKGYELKNIKKKLIEKINLMIIYI